MTNKSAYREVIAKGATGFHHVCVWSYDFYADIKFFESRGLKIVNSGSLGITKFAYIDTQSVMGCMFEIATKNEEVDEFTKVIAGAAQDWDGKNLLNMARNSKIKSNRPDKPDLLATYIYPADFLHNHFHSRNPIRSFPPSKDVC